MRPGINGSQSLYYEPGVEGQGRPSRDGFIERLFTKTIHIPFQKLIKGENLINFDHTKKRQNWYR